MFTDNIQQISPPLPPPALGPRDSLLPFPADHHLPYLVPALFYWVISFIFHHIDTRCLLSKYKLHTSAEHLTKNRASRRDVIKFALIQQAAQCLLGYLMADDKEQFVSPEYAAAVWAQRLRTAQVKSSLWTSYVGLTVPRIMDGSSLLGLTAPKVFAQDQFRESLANSTHVVMDPNLGAAPFTSGELFLAKTVYWVLFPTLQYVAAMILADTFQYFTHRAFHVNKWLYKHIHSMHHDIYVPFAYGAFYNHPLETIPIDGIGFPICLSLAGLDNRQAAFFGALWTFKTVVDHCGYNFPYNPCNLVCPNSVLSHDLHHQTWGMKYNFSVYGAFWDWAMGTRWSPLDSKAQAKYRKGKVLAEAVTAKAGAQVQTSEPTVGESSAVSS